MWGNYAFVLKNNFISKKLHKFAVVNGILIVSHCFI